MRLSLAMLSKDNGAASNVRFRTACASAIADKEEGHSSVAGQIVATINNPGPGHGSPEHSKVTVCLKMFSLLAPLQPNYTFKHQPLCVCPSLSILFFL